MSDKSNRGIVHEKGMMDEWLSLLLLEASGSDGARRVLRLLRDVRWVTECGPGCLLRRYLHCIETVVRASAIPSPGPGHYRRRFSKTNPNRSPSPSAAALHAVPKDVLSRAWRRVWAAEDGPRTRRRTLSATPRCTPCGTPCGTPSDTPRGTPRVSFSLHREGRRATWGPASEEALNVAKAWGCIGDFRRRRSSCFAFSPRGTEDDEDDSNEDKDKAVVALAWGCITPEPAPEEGDRTATVGLSDKGLNVLLPLAEWAQEAYKQHRAGNKCYRRFTDGTILAHTSTEAEDDRASPDLLCRPRCNTI